MGFQLAAISVMGFREVNGPDHSSHWFQLAESQWIERFKVIAVSCGGINLVLLIRHPWLIKRVRGAAVPTDTTR